MKHIVVIDYTLEGHHLSFISSFCIILLKQGHMVSCLVPGYEKVEDWIKTKHTGILKNFKGFQYTIHKKNNSTFEVLQSWRNEARLVRTIELNRRKNVDLVFFAWLDYQLAPNISSYLLNILFPFKWSGLYFHPYHLKQSDVYLNRKANWRDIDSVFLSANCIAVAVHDQSIIEKYSDRIGKNVIHFPETADETQPDFANEHYRKIREYSNGRLVIGIIGCEKHKGTLTMMRMAKEADASLYFFAFLGILPMNTYTKEEWNEIQSFIALKMENCYFYFESIPEGPAYNAVFNAFDIPFLVYDNFISSSNRLTKAAIFSKLVLAPDNYCLGHDVRKYSLGETIKPGEYKLALIAIKRLSERIRNKRFPIKEWNEYRKINSEETLFDKFSEIISLI